MVQTVVVGLGRSGVGAAEFLHANQIPTAAIDSGSSEQLQRAAERLKHLGLDVALNTPLLPSSFERWRPELKTVVISPGIPWTHPTLVQLRAEGIEVKGEMGVAWDALQHIPWVGITGTNGKTTVTHLLSHVLNASGCAAPMGGNVGVSATDLARRLQTNDPKPDWLVMELSSYQIEAAPSIRPRIGIWTTLTPDHLERHGTLEAYRAIKRGLLQRSDLAIYNADDPDLRRQRPELGPGLWISAESSHPESLAVDLWIDPQGQIQSPQGALCAADALAMPGEHNRQNLLLVCAAAQAIGLSASAIESGLRSFPGVPHRLEPIGTVNGIAAYNDSKATNYDAAAVGLKAVAGPVVVLAGGQTKQGDASDWLDQLKRKAVAIVLFGAGARELEGMINAADFQGTVRVQADLQAAVPEAIALAGERKAVSLLLSPACASFDQYSDFEARGDHFRSLIANVQAQN
ncbi:MAG: UDP-N-acetylmuramoyl-L-alanine--D-glutamate ligase [Synechococcus sp.]